MNQLNAPMVFLATENTVFLVLGDGKEPLITWSQSYAFACEQADIHQAVVVAVPVVRDSSWRSNPHQVPVPAASLPRKDHVAGSFAVTLPVPDEMMPVPADALQIIGGVDSGGYPLGRAARGGQVRPDGWSAIREDVVGQVNNPPAAPLVQRVKPFGDPEAPELPEDREAALTEAFVGNTEAIAALGLATQADVGTLERIIVGLKK